jgi:GTPase
MSVPKVAIVGRPNVGKSSLLNWISNKRISVVEPTAGVTRDRVTYLMHQEGRYYELVDTGGIGIVDSDDLSTDIERQIDIGIEQAELILFVVDGDAGIMPLDQEVARKLRKSNKRILLVVNKCDSPKLDSEATRFLRLLNAPYLCTSVTGNRGRDELKYKILDLLPLADATEQEDGERQAAEPELKLAIVGRRNVGKSTFINSLARTERMIVSEIAGTTRDSVDVRFELDGKAFIAIDTPGVRKRKSLANDIEVYGMFRAKRSIRRADVVLMFFDAAEELSMVDKQLVHYISEEYKPCVFVVNKWDLGKQAKMSSEAWGKYLVDTFPLMRYTPVAFITAKESVNIKQLINLTQAVAKQSALRVSTSKINAVIRAAVLANRPPMRAQKQPKVYYGTQVASSPPTIVLKCNFPKLVDRTWQRFLLNVMREHLPFREVPIKLYLRSRTKGESHAAGIDEWQENDFRLTESPESEDWFKKARPERANDEATDDEFDEELADDEFEGDVADEFDDVLVGVPGDDDDFESFDPNLEEGLAEGIDGEFAESFDDDMDADDLNESDDDDLDADAVDGAEELTDVVKPAKPAKPLRPVDPKRSAKPKRPAKPNQSGRSDKPGLGRGRSQRQGQGQSQGRGRGGRKKKSK